MKYPKVDDILINSILNEFDEFDESDLYFILKKLTTLDIDLKDIDFLKTIDLELTEKHQYAQLTSSGFQYYILTENGKLVKNSGGHFAYLKKNQEKSIADKDRQERKDESEKLDLQIKRWQVKTKFFPYIVSTLALGVSIFSYFKPEKKQQDLQPMQEQIEQLKDRVKLLDSLLQLDTLLKKRN